MTQDEAGLFAVSAAFGAGFSGIIPAYELVKKSHLREGSCDSLGEGSIRGVRT